MKTVALARRSSLTGLAAILALALFATACSSSKKTASAPKSTTVTSSAAPAGGGSPAAGGTLVHVKDFAFNPGTVTVPVGSAVTWQFDDSISHNVEASDNSFSSKDLNNGAKFTFTFSKAGTYSYICSIHPRMKATVIVK